MIAACKEAAGLLIVAHGERHEAATNSGLLAHAAEIGVRWRHAWVKAAVLNGAPLLESALKDARERNLRRLIVYPYFMSGGYMVARALSQRLRGAVAGMEISIARPLGLDPRLPRLVMDESLHTAAAAGFEPSRTRLLVVGHGSRSVRESAASTVHMANSLRSCAVFAAVDTAFLEQEPLLHSELKRGRLQTVVVGWLCGRGQHARRDVPAAIDETDAEAVYTGPIGVHPEIPNLIMDAVVDALASMHPPRTGSVHDVLLQE